MARCSLFFKHRILPKCGVFYPHLGKILVGRVVGQGLFQAGDYGLAGLYFISLFYKDF